MRYEVLAAAAGLAAMALSSPAWAAPPPAGSVYVALGSSYAAGTGLPRTADDSPQGCNQGTENYPRQVARALGLKLVDRSCGGATTVHVLKGGQFGLPAQLDAVDAQARLVTITIGGNDVRFTADLGLLSCDARGPAPAAPPCAAAPADFSEEQAFAAMETGLAEIVARIRRQAPQARIVFVDYLTVLPPAGTCADLGLDEREASTMRARAARLAAATARVARQSGADLVRASSLGEAHHVCAAEPWAWGVQRGERPPGPFVGFHPRPAGIAAIAQGIVQLLKTK